MHTTSTGNKMGCPYCHEDLRRRQYTSDPSNWIAFGSTHQSMEMCALLVGGTNLVLGSWNNENNWPFVILRALMSL